MEAPPKDRRCIRSFGGAVPLGLQHRLLQQLQIHVVPHAHQKARLLGTQNIARPADFKIAHGDFEAEPNSAYSRIADRRLAEISVSALPCR